MQEIQDDDPDVRAEVKVCVTERIGIFDLWLGKNEEGSSLDTEVQEDPYLKDKSSIISLYN